MLNEKTLSDLALAAFLSSKGYELLGIKGNGRKSLFVFEDTPELEQDVLKYFNVRPPWAVRILRFGGSRKSGLAICRRPGKPSGCICRIPVKSICLIPELGRPQNCICGILARAFGFPSRKVPESHMRTYADFQREPSVFRRVTFKKSLESLFKYVYLLLCRKVVYKRCVTFLQQKIM